MKAKVLFKGIDQDSWVVQIHASDCHLCESLWTSYIEKFG